MGQRLPDGIEEGRIRIETNAGIAIDQRDLANVADHVLHGLSPFLRRGSGYQAAIDAQLHL